MCNIQKVNDTTDRSKTLLVSAWQNALQNSMENIHADVRV